MATISAFKVPKIQNEKLLHYEPGSESRSELEAALKAYKNKAPIQVPLVVAGKHIKEQSVHHQPNPADHATHVAAYSTASEADVKNAIEAALAAKSQWETLPFADRAAIFLKAADLIAGKYRYEILAATMLGQGKTAWQAEIDAAAELCDFLRFNVAYAEELYAQQPVHNAPGMWNRLEYRPLEGFVYAVSPFNFTAIGGNLPCAPALMGNVVVWKPSPSAMASNWLIYCILREAGLPPNVVQFVPGDADAVTAAVLAHPRFASLHFTGSTAVFRALYGRIAEGVAAGRYRGYPRIVGETGGKNYHLLHPSADVRNAAVHTARGAFEYQGQKCSATSRVYVPLSLSDAFVDALVEETQKLDVGPPDSFANFVGPVIHKGAFDRLKKVVEDAKNDEDLKLLYGGHTDGSKGWFVNPTVYRAYTPLHKLLSTELFGPILTLYVYDDSSDHAFEDACRLVDSTSDYALTGAVFATDREAVRYAEDALRNSAGNFYINCKSTGSVVGQQPFGGARASGTNDKAGSINLLMRFVSPRSIKEEFNETKEVLYPSNKS